MTQTLPRRPSFGIPGIVALCVAGCTASPPSTSDAVPGPSVLAPSSRPPSDGPSAIASAAQGPLAPTIPGDAPTAAAATTIVGAAHILVAYKGALGAATTITRSKADAKKRAGEAREKLLAHQGTFEELVVKYSDDGLSKPAGGKLGNFERNVFPTAFSDATFALAVGGVSEVVETARGFHVITRTK